MSHTWRFFRSGGFDQVIIDTVDDLEALDSLDKKLWAALACPTKGIEFDERTLNYIDSDADGRIRVPELLAAVRWALDHLKTPEVLLRGKVLPLAAINELHPEGKKILASATELLSRLGKNRVDELSVADTADLAKMFPPSQPNGDGLIPAALAIDPVLADAIKDIIATLGSEADRSGEPAVSADKINTFFADLATLVAWQQQLTSDPNLLPLAAQTGPALDALLVVEAKIDDYFVRSQLAGFDDRATPLMNGSEAQFSALSAQLLTLDNSDTQSLPLAKVQAHQSLPLAQGLNPAWQTQMQAFVNQTVIPVFGPVSHLNQGQWQNLKQQFAAYRAWLAAKPALAIANLADDRLQAVQQAGLQNELLALVAQDLSVADAANALVDLDRLVRYQANLLKLINNFVALSDFYEQRDKAIFQAGTLYIDSRSCDLAVRVSDMAKHASMAGLSNSYLVYCDCTRKDNPDKMTIVAAMTAGDAGNLMVGRNGVFYDRAGKDWDASVVKLIENPISVREAFWMPYRRMSRMINNQLQKMAADRDKEIEAKSMDQVATSVAKVQEAAKTPKDAPAKPGTPPVQFDAAKFAGIFAAIGLAIGAIGTAIASVITGFLGLIWWQMPVAIAGLLLLISGPSMIMAWFKLRQRNLSPILDANGWAINTRAKINIPFGTTLTQLATLPKGAQRNLKDPFA